MLSSERNKPLLTRLPHKNRRQPMSNQDFRKSSPSSRPDRTQSSEALSKATALAGEAADKIRQTASDTAVSIGGEVKHLLDQQIGSGASVVGHFANSAKRAAEELDRDVPQLAGVVRAVADRMDGYAGDLRGQSLDQLLKSASDFTRRQPALVFGLAALAGFVVMRTIKSTPTVSSPSIQPEQEGRDRLVSSFHGPELS